MRVSITIKPSPTADTRTCDYTQVSKEQLLKSSIQHKEDIAQALGLFQILLSEAAFRHDHDKLSAIDHFFSDFQTGFRETGWWTEHRRINRHHLTMYDGIPDDVNLIDVLDYIADCVMAGLGRSGKVSPLYLPDRLLQEAFQNTVNLLKAAVTVEKAEQVEVAK